MATPQHDWELYQAYAAIGVMAVLPIYIGSYAGLKYPKQKGKKTDDDDEDEEKEFFSFDDAKWYPVVGSVTLFSMYLILKFVSKDIINLLLTLNFTFLGFFAIFEVVLDGLRYLTGFPLKGSFLLSLAQLPSKKGSKSEDVFKLRFGYVHLVIGLIVACTTALYLYSKHWILSNIFGLSFSITAIKLLNLDSFATGMVLLAGLFFYDVFWVFGTEVMVTVAKGLDVPIKVVFPKSFIAILEQGILNKPEGVGFTMLGLGDIVIPGVFVALCLSYDHFNYLNSAAGKKNKQSRWFPTPYFTTCFIMYILGLFTTIYVMHTFKAAQPALLYLSPACIISALGVAIIRGDLKGLFDFAPQGSALHETKKGTQSNENVKVEKDDTEKKRARKRSASKKRKVQ
ncbi:hypothetical protein BCR33DRAFT_676131 [Rhizoclosmatium globosum]|uniref:Peptidase A22B, signal peptide peptidase n=1 Tax=Rhizoclosmatium globosum TaxID=329046 RepID=A0A1Y2CXH3_9FUNG|nr:hypothetical protein BCR33DRAFT_676131 [Rhizoclosmatium globosum]|eukprot:ORY51596.1 hypothetical protein BCR33DRAFT_676131 [Rhizoclosmatium globosum]